MKGSTFLYIYLNFKLWKISGNDKLSHGWHPPMELVTAAVHPAVQLHRIWNPTVNNKILWLNIEKIVVGMIQ